MIIDEDDDDDDTLEVRRRVWAAVSVHFLSKQNPRREGGNQARDIQTPAVLVKYLEQHCQIHIQKVEDARLCGPSLLTEPKVTQFQVEAGENPIQKKSPCVSGEIRIYNLTYTLGELITLITTAITKAAGTIAIISMNFVV